MFSFSVQKLALPLVSPMLVSTEAAMLSNSSSISGPVRETVPPRRRTCPVIPARAIFFGGSNKFPVRTEAKPLTIGRAWSSKR